MKKRKDKIVSLLLVFSFLSVIITTTEVETSDKDVRFEINSLLSPFVYTPKFDSLNLKEEMTLSPMFTPDNALEIHKWWIDRANDTIEVQNQYLTMFDSGDDWDLDSSPIVRALVDANNSRGVNVRVQINEDDPDNVTSYFQSKGVDVRWMGSSYNNPDEEYLSNTHNKLVIIDKKVTLLSSINFGENAFTNNREAGMVIQNTAVADYYTSIFESDWIDGEVPSGSPIKFSLNNNNAPPIKTNPQMRTSYISPTNIPLANFTGIYNVTLFTNPDNADEVIFHYLKAAKTSVFVSMYTISRPDFNKTLIDLKKANPSIDIQVLISNRRVHPAENTDTTSAAESLVDNLIPVYNSTKDLNYYHNKYWIIDGTHVFIYSGNWSPRSVSQLEIGDTYFSSGDVNRDMGIAVHDAPDIASFFKEEVWDKDVAVASAWDLPIGIKQNSFSKADVVFGTVILSGQISGLEDATVSYRWGIGEYSIVTKTNGGFSVEFDTRTLPNGITPFEVKAETPTQTFTDKVTVNVVNYAPSENWRFLITELLPNPSEVSDTEGEYIELTNSFPFDLLIEGWKVGDDNALYTFPSDYIVEAYSSIVIAKDTTGFENAYGIAADLELGIALKNSGDFSQLQNQYDHYIDIVAYGDSTAYDGSAVLDTPDAGEAILRTPLHIDTDTEADFTFNSPDPKGTVPQVPLETKTDASTTDGTTTEETPLTWSIIVSTLLILPIIRRRLR